MKNTHYLTLLMTIAGLSLAMPTIAETVINPDKELLITDVRVVDSPRAKYPGPFSFGKLMERLVHPAGPPPVDPNQQITTNTPSDMMRFWLETWTKTQEINGSQVAPRDGIVEKLIKPWQKRDGYDPSQGDWKPNLANAPFRLLAIVNRLDLAGQQMVQSLRNAEVAEERDEFKKQTGKDLRLPTPPRDILSVFQPGGGGSGSGGWGAVPFTIPLLVAAEGRFVFCAIDDSGEPMAGGFTVILEYPLTNEGSFKNIREWAQAWHELGRHESFDESYLSSLERITNNFAASNANNATIRVRTNEKCFGAVREMREFSYAGNGVLSPAPLAQTPCGDFHDAKGKRNELLAKYLSTQAPEILAGRVPFPGGFNVDVPKKLRGSTSGTLHPSEVPAVLPILAGKCDLPEQSPGFCWEFRILREEHRRQFSLQTCNGCHCGETNTTDGLHIKPRSEGSPAELSAFLQKGKLKVKDPANGNPVTYTELQDRMEMLELLLEEKPRSQQRKLEQLSQKRLRRSH